MRRPADRKDRIVAALAGKPLDPQRLRASAAANSIEGARQAAKRAGADDAVTVTVQVSDETWEARD